MDTGTYTLKQADYSSTSSLPNGGWGWVIVFGSFMISLFTDGFSFTSGVFYEKFLRIYNQNEAVTSMFISVMTGMISCIGPVASGLSQVYGCRAVSIAGALIAVFGMCISTLLDTSMYWHTVTLGLIVGIGLGLLYLPQVIIITEWFDTRLSFATGIAVCGSGFGIAIFAMMSDYMIEVFDWKGAMLILASMMSCCILFSATFKSPPKSTPCLAVSVLTASNQSSQSKLSKRDMFRQAMIETFNFKILSEPMFLYFIVANFFASIVYYVPLILTSDRMIRIGFGTSNNGAQLMAYFGIANGFARTFFGYISDISCINRTTLYGLSIISMSMVVALTTLTESFSVMKVLYVCFGIAEGAHTTLSSVVLVDLYGAERVYNTFGIVLLFDGIAAVIGPPITNMMVAFDDSYNSSILFCSLLELISGSMLMLLPLFRKRLESMSHLNKQSNINHTNQQC